MQILDTNQQVVDTNQQLKQQIIDVASTPRIVNNNNSFNLNTFLNVQCKDAMNLSDFIDQIHISFQDLLFLGRNGFVNAFKDTFIKKLQSMDQTLRPIHCTDQKRKTCVVKQNNKWQKDDDHLILYNAIDLINRKQLSAFSHHAKNRDKDYLADDTNLDNNSHIIIEMCGYNKDNRDAMHKQILRYITTTATINKLGFWVYFLSHFFLLAERNNQQYYVI